MKLVTTKSVNCIVPVEFVSVARVCQSRKLVEVNTRKTHPGELVINIWTGPFGESMASLIVNAAVLPAATV